DFCNTYIDFDFKHDIKCKSRYILVFELYNEDELKDWKKCEKYNDTIKNLATLFTFEFEYATNKYHIFNGINGIYGIKKAIRKRIDTFIHVIEAIKNRFSKTTKRIYILDIKKDLQLIYAAKIANINIKNELKELLYKLDDALCSNKEMLDYISIDDLEENIKKQVHLDTASLTIENINSTISDIPQEAKNLVNIIANDDEFINNSFDITVRLDANKSFYRWYNFLLSQIKVYLVKKEDMPTMEEYIGKYDIKKEDIDNITQQTRISKALGCYYRNPRNIAGKEVKICICPELIEDFADSIGIDKNIAYAKVIVHEFAHAMMDEQNVVSLDKDKQYLDYTISNNLSFHDPHFRFVMEESVANCITLNKFKASYLKNSDIVINDVIKFIEHQPDAYKFGIKQSNAKIKVCKWRTLKDKIDKNKAEEWLRKYFFNNEPYNAEAFNDLFDAKSN
ncbi:MAG: hypothetical protein ACOCM4_15625, partial [Acetivibrio ethanolgignens]